MTTCRTLIDALRQRTHLRDAGTDLLPEQHSAATRLGALADHDFDRIRLAQIVWIEAVSRWQTLINERLRRLPLFGRHAAVTRGRRRAELAGRAPQRFLHICRQRAEA